MDNFHGAEDSTPIDDISGLIPWHISTKKELDVWEAENENNPRHCALNQDLEIKTTNKI